MTWHVKLFLWHMNGIQTVLLCMYVVTCTPHQPSHHQVAALVRATTPVATAIYARKVNQGTSWDLTILPCPLRSSGYPLAHLGMRRSWEAGSGHVRLQVFTLPAVVFLVLVSTVGHSTGKQSNINWIKNERKCAVHRVLLAWEAIKVSIFPYAFSLQLRKLNKRDFN